MLLIIKLNRLGTSLDEKRTISLLSENEATYDAVFNHLTRASNLRNEVTSYADFRDRYNDYFNSRARTPLVLFMRADNVEENTFGGGENNSDITRVMRQLGFRRCDTCHKWIPPQDVAATSTYNRTTGKRTCSICANASTQGASVMRTTSYHGGSSRHINQYGISSEGIPSDFMGYGIELEMISRTPREVFDRENNSFAISQAFKDYNTQGSLLNAKWRTERDGSLDNQGVEFISSAIDYRHIGYFADNLLPLMRQLEDMGYIDSNKAGLHIHTSKLLYGSTEQEQALNVAKIALFMAKYEADWRKLSRRSDFGYCAIPTEATVNRWIDSLKNGSIVSCDFLRLNGRGALHHSSGTKTIEFRIFKSTGDLATLKHTILLVDGIIKNIKNVPINKMYCLGRVLKLVPQETLSFWRSRGCFLTTIAKDTATMGEYVTATTSNEVSR